MKLPNWFGRSSPLQAALERGLADGGNLEAELEDLDDLEVSSRADALAICTALTHFLTNGVPEMRGHFSPLYAVVALFQDVETADCDAFSVLQRQGTPLLVSLFHRSQSQPASTSERDQLFILRILAMYETQEGADTVVEAAREPFAPHAYHWSVILGAFKEGHPYAVRVFTELASPLPSGFLVISLLDAANHFLLHGGECRHPFDSDEGIERLEGWLSDHRPDHASYAVSAATALPFLTHARRDALLDVAMQHADRAVAIEAAWAAARTGDERGIGRLATLCLDVNRSSQARHYLEELGRGDTVPSDALAPAFQARAEFAQWLAHPNELGRVPDEVEVMDHRELKWPPEFEPKPLWLLRFHARAQTELDEDDTGIGLVGGVTWCFFGYALDERPPEDGYAIHYCWELEQAKLLKLDRVEGDSMEYDSLVADWTGPQLEFVRIENVAELSPRLRHPRRLLAVAAARLDGRDGWVVLDGPASRWYAADERPAQERSATVLAIHLGRRLLDLPETVSPKTWLKPSVRRPPAQIVEAYERLVARFESLPAGADEEMKQAYEQLGRHSQAYLEALAAVAGQAPQIRLAVTYERLFGAARQAAAVLGEDAFDSHSVLGDLFDGYVQALITLGRPGEIPALIAFFAPHWTHNLGYGRLGAAAFTAGAFDTAETFCLKLKHGLDDWHRCEEMSLLARIWVGRGQREEGRALLLECLKEVSSEARSASPGDRELHEEWFQTHRRTFLELFPNDPALAARAFPETLLARRSLT